MDWLRYLQAPQIWPANNPVGTSRVDVMTTPRPTVSPVASAVLNSPDQRIGRFWKVATGQAKEAYTGADMADLAKAGNEGLDAALGWTGMTTPIRAYHGSPHTFDRFDLSKIGTGEGAQAYGHGLYFADNEGVAGSYRSLLSRVPLVNGKQVTGLEGAAENYLVNAGGDAAAALKAAQDEAVALLQSTRKIDQIRAAGAQQAIAKLQEWNATNAVTKPGGSMYEVSLRTSPERLLDWDKPLSQQPAAVREALKPHVEQYYKGVKQSYDRPMDGWGELATKEAAPSLDDVLASNTGESFYKTLTNTGRVSGTNALRDAGIDGIQYLDAGSRAAGEGSRNYVMFRDDIIDILKRYGLFGLGMVGGGAAATQAPSQ